MLLLTRIWEIALAWPWVSLVTVGVVFTAGASWLVRVAGVGEGEE